MAAGPRSTRNSLKSLTLAAKMVSSYSFMAEPQPAELTTMASTPAWLNSSIRAVANLCASVCAAVVEGEGAAAALGWGDYYVAAFGGQDSGGGDVDLGEEDLLDAAGEHADDGAAGTSAVTRAGRWPRGARLEGRLGATLRAAAISGARRSARLRCMRRSSLVRWAARSGAISRRSRPGRERSRRWRRGGRVPWGDRGGSGLDRPRRVRVAQARAARSACRSGRRTGRPGRRPCSPGSGPGARPPHAAEATVPSSRPRPSSSWLIRWIRPRGESISSPQS